MPNEVIVEEPEVQSDAELLNSDEEVVVEEPKTEEPEEKEPEEEKKSDEDKPFPYERHSIQEIKAKYPEFFKDFPIFRDVVFREQEFTKHFATIEDAKEALEDSTVLQSLRESVLEGKSETVLDAVMETDPKAAERFSLSFLPTLRGKNSELYTKTISPLFESFVKNLYNSDDENTRNAAIVAARWLFGKDKGDQVIDGKITFGIDFRESEEEKKFKAERESFQTEQYKSFYGSVLEDMEQQRRTLILRGLDPDKTLTDTQRDLLVKLIADKVDASLVADENHMKIMNARWLRSKKEGFNQASKEKIISAYLSRAKQVIPSIRDKEKAAFLGTKARAALKKSEEIDEKSSVKKEVTSGRVTSNGKPSPLKPSKELYRRMSDIEILGME